MCQESGNAAKHPQDSSPSPPRQKYPTRRNERLETAIQSLNVGHFQLRSVLQVIQPPPPPPPPPPPHPPPGREREREREKGKEESGSVPKESRPTRRTQAARSARGVVFSGAYGTTATTVTAATTSSIDRPRGFLQGPRGGSWRAVGGGERGAGGRGMKMVSIVNLGLRQVGGGATVEMAAWRRMRRRPRQCKYAQRSIGRGRSGRSNGEGRRRRRSC